MSGGSYDYIYCKVREAADYAQDAEISELLCDLSNLLHDEEWWQSSDSSKEKYLQSLKAFKEKWFKSSREERIKQYLDRRIQEVKQELEAMI